MTLSEELGLGGLAAIGTIGSVCAILLKSTHQNLITLDTMRREASAVAENLRQELRDHDDTIFKLQGLCADYRYAIAKLEAERDLLRRALEARQTPSTPAENHKSKTKPEDVV